MPCCVLHRLETRTTGKSGLPGGTVASFNRFLGVPLFGAKIGGCTPFWRSPFILSRSEYRENIVVLSCGISRSQRLTFFYDILV